MTDDRRPAWPARCTACGLVTEDPDAYIPAPGSEDAEARACLATTDGRHEWAREGRAMGDPPPEYPEWARALDALMDRLDDNRRNVDAMRAGLLFAEAWEAVSRRKRPSMSVSTDRDSWSAEAGWRGGHADGFGPTLAAALSDLLARLGDGR